MPEHARSLPLSSLLYIAVSNRDMMSSNVESKRIFRATWEAEIPGLFPATTAAAARNIEDDHAFAVVVFLPCLAASPPHLKRVDALALLVERVHQVHLELLDKGERKRAKRRGARERKKMKNFLEKSEKTQSFFFRFFFRPC